MILMMERFRNLFSLIITLIFICCCFFTFVDKTYADSEVTVGDHSKEIKRSIESLQDLDYQTWQMIVYPRSRDSKKLILRIVGYPGSLRIDHPKELMVNSGRKTWNLKDITKSNQNKAETLNDSVAEFDMSPFISQLDKNRPLRFRLPGFINELPIPPYLVSEWRSLVQ